jgi:predicted RNA-binding Zn ribbon-like protein
VPVPLPANTRAAVAPAPGGLELVQELLNTAAIPSPTPPPDLLADPASAQAWSDAVLTDRGMPPARIDASGAAALRRLRLAVASAIRVRDGREVGMPPATGALTLRFDGRGTAVVVAPEDAPDAPAIAGLVLAEVFAAQARGDWHRLKLCALDACSFAFYDHSRNSSARYHELRCANYVNLQNSRRRRRDAAAGEAAPAG